MKKRARFVKAVFLGVAGIFLACSCAGKEDTAQKQENTKYQEAPEKGVPNTIQETTDQEAPETMQETTVQEAAEDVSNSTKQAEPQMIQADWSEYFHGLHGAAVLYDASAMQYTIYHKKLAKKRRSPCSTFKIISSMIALEHGILDPAHSVRRWTGETFWKDTWNQDLDFRMAFRESCVWYFRELTDEIGRDLMQAELDRLMYGNCDISDWEGRLNTSQNNRALTGFWIESSLAVSPKEQAEVMERIFGEDSIYKKQTQQELKKVMLVEQEQTDASIYGKTGMGMDQGIVVDAWFSGFAGKGGRQIYFCVYLGRTDGADVTSAAAKEIAVRLVADYF